MARFKHLKGKEIGRKIGAKIKVASFAQKRGGGGASYISDQDFSDMLFKKSRISFCVAPYLKLRVLRGQESFSHSPAKHSSSFAEATADKPANGLFFQA
jgi:hypothetical protein